MSKNKEILLLYFLFCFGWNFGAGTDLAMAKRLEGANNPELLPKEYTTVIDVAGFLSQGQVCPLLALASSKWV